MLLSGIPAFTTKLLIALAISTTSSLAEPPSPDATFDGIWRSQGYGFVIDANRRGQQVYDVTDATCLHQPAEAGYATALLARAVLATNGDSFTTRAPYGLTTLSFDKLAALPELCAATPPDPADPLYNFDVFWHTLNDEYAFFARRAVDWNAIRETYRPQISADTSDKDLTDIFHAIYRQLQDRHMAMFAGQDYINAEFPPVLMRWFTEYSQDPSASMTTFLGDKITEYLNPSWDRYLDAGSVKRVSDLVTTGSAVNGEIGYVLISGEAGYTQSDDVDQDVTAALTQWDSVFVGLAGKRGLILDMRINSGGNDAAVLGLMGLLTNDDRAGFTKCARDGAGFTPLQTTAVTARQNAFVSPVVILISSLNWSAGENFAMMARDLPNVILIGENTAGVHSDTLAKYLPNGWSFTVSNEIIVAPDGQSYEGVGVPPDVVVPFDIEEIKATGIDPQMERALHLLNSGDFQTLVAGAERMSEGLGRPSPCGH
jgi:carboxyl-terminal processing protease